MFGKKMNKWTSKCVSMYFIIIIWTVIFITKTAIFTMKNYNNEIYRHNKISFQLYFDLWK